MGASRAAWIRLLLALAAAGAGCKSPEATRTCPAPFVADAGRAAAIVGRLAASGEGARLVDGAQRPLLCFGETQISMVTTDRVLLLDARLGDAEAAARAAHLLLHVGEGLTDPGALRGDCEAQVEKALGAEARALGLELRLRRALGVERPVVSYDFEGAYFAAPPGDREKIVLDYLRAHPDGAPGIDALASGYARRCRESR